MPEFDVVVVGYSEHLENCLESIYSNTHSSRTTVIENRPGLLWPKNHCSRVICPGENIGWVKAANAGLALATAPHVVLMNDDTAVETDDWLPKMRSHFTKNTACVGPRSNHRGFQGRLKKPYRRRAWPPCLSFFCVMFSREALQEVGYLDERFDYTVSGGRGGDDDDWLKRAHHAGYRVAFAPEVFVRHIGSASFGKLNAPSNAPLLEKKWRE